MVPPMHLWHNLGLSPSTNASNNHAKILSIYAMLGPEVVLFNSHSNHIVGYYIIEQINCVNFHQTVESLNLKELLCCYSVNRITVLYIIKNWDLPHHQYSEYLWLLLPAHQSALSYIKFCQRIQLDYYIILFLKELACASSLSIDHNLMFLVYQLLPSRTILAFQLGSFLSLYKQFIQSA